MTTTVKQDKKNKLFRLQQPFMYSAVLLVAVFLTASCATDKKEKSLQKTTPIIIEATTVFGEHTQEVVVGSGKISAQKSATISTRLMGFIDGIPVKIGDYVRKGQVLIRLNNADLQAKNGQVTAGVSAAKAGYTVAFKNYNRFKNLFEKSSISAKEMDDMTAQFKMAEAQLEAAKQLKNEVAAQLKYARITAPFSGTITQIFFKEGDMASPGIPLMYLENNSVFEVDTRVSEHEIATIENGTTVSIRVDAISETLEGSVTEVSNATKNSGGQYGVTVLVTTPNSNVLSGMYATVQFPVKKQQIASVLLPKTALVYNGQLTGVYTVSQQNTALLRWLRIGKDIGGNVEVLSGLSVGETYILSAEGKLYNGAPITQKRQ